MLSMYYFHSTINSNFKTKQEEEEDDDESLLCITRLLLIEGVINYAIHTK